MVFKVTPKVGPSFNLTPDKLYEQLMLAIIDKNKDKELEGASEVLGVLGDWLTGTGYIIKHELRASLWLSFKLGYFFARFLEKQQVDIIKEEEK